VSVLPETSLTNIAQINLNYQLSFLFSIALSGRFKGSHFVGSDSSPIWVNDVILKGVPLNIQTNTVLSIHDPVKGYYLKLLLAIYEIIYLGKVGVLPVYFWILCQSYWVKLNVFCL
jgi:hypothetical protein